MPAFLHRSLIIFLIALSGRNLAQKDSVLFIRPAFELRLAIDSGAFFKAPIKESVYLVNEGTLQLFPGETLFVEADVEYDRLVDLKVVPKIVHKEKTMTISFNQKTEGKKHQMMILQIVNPFNLELRYNAEMNLMESGQWAKTPVLPISAGLTAYETWPDPLISLVLSDFVLRKR